jgi:hypothetical protein
MTKPNQGNLEGVNERPRCLCQNGFMQSLPDNGKVTIKTTRSDGKVKEGNFDLGAVSDVRRKIAYAYDWDDTPNEPVGSVDDSEHR